MAYYAIAVTVIGAAYGAYSQYQAGQQAKSLDDYNSQLKQQDAQAVLVASANRSLSQRTQNTALLAKQEASYASAGVVVSTGSPLTVRVKSAENLELNALNTEYEGDIGSRSDYQMANALQAKGTNDLMAGDAEATSTLLNGAGKAAGYKVK